MWLREMAEGLRPRTRVVEGLHSGNIRLRHGDLVEVFAPPYPGPGRRSIGKFPRFRLLPQEADTAFFSGDQNGWEMADRRGTAVRAVVSERIRQRVRSQRHQQDPRRRWAAARSLAVQPSDSEPSDDARGDAAADRECGGDGGR